MEKEKNLIYSKRVWLGEYPNHRDNFELNLDLNPDEDSEFKAVILNRNINSFKLSVSYDKTMDGFWGEVLIFDEKVVIPPKYIYTIYQYRYSNVEDISSSQKIFDNVEAEKTIVFALYKQKLTEHVNTDNIREFTKFFEDGIYLITENKSGNSLLVTKWGAEGIIIHQEGHYSQISPSEDFIKKYLKRTSNENNKF